VAVVNAPVLVELVVLLKNLGNTVSGILAYVVP
jgi:hypothetical protein